MRRASRAVMIPLVVAGGNLLLTFLAWTYATGNTATRMPRGDFAAALFRLLSFPVGLSGEALDRYFAEALIVNALLWGIIAGALWVLLTRGFNERHGAGSD